MIIDELKAAIERAKVKPKGIKVTSATWNALKTANLIEMKDVGAFGLFDLGFKLPFYGDIYIFIDPELEISNRAFELPAQSL